MTDVQPYQMRLPVRAWWCMRIMLFLFIIGAMFMLSGYWLLSEFVQDFIIDQTFSGDLEAYDVRIDWVLLLGISLYPIFYLGTVIAYAFVYVRSMMNAKHLDPVTATVATHGMYWWYAIPFAALWKPIEGVIQVWRVVRRQADQSDKLPWVFAAWWGGFLLFNSASRGLDLFHPAADLETSMVSDATSAQNYMFWSMGKMVLGIVSAACLYWITERIYKAQAIILDQTARPDPEAC